MEKTAEQYTNIAARHYNSGQYYEALIACENAIKLDPKSARAFHGKGLILAEQEKYDEALDSYLIAFQLDPSNSKLIIDKFKVVKILYEREIIERQIQDQLDKQKITPPYSGGGYYHPFNCTCNYCS